MYKWREPKEPMSTQHERLNRREITLRIRRILLEKGLSEADLVKESRLSANSIRQLIVGNYDAHKSRQTVTNVVGVELWSGIPPEPGAAELRKVREGLKAIEALYDRIPDEVPAAPDTRLARELRAILSPELRAAVAAARSRLPLSLVDRFAELLPPKEFDALFGIRRAPGNPRKFVIRQPA